MLKGRSRVRQGYEKTEVRDKDELDKFGPLDDEALNMVFGGMSAYEASQLKSGDKVRVKDSSSTYYNKVYTVVTTETTTIGSPLTKVWVEGIADPFNSSQLDKA